jgi:flagellar protein FliO/FliZ
VESVLRLFSAIIVFLLVLALTYFVTRWLGKYQQGVAGNRNITVLETFKVTQNKYLQVVKVGEAYMVIAICKDSITMLTRLDASELGDIPLEPEQNTGDFADILERLKKRIPKK